MTLPIDAIERFSPRLLPATAAFIIDTTGRNFETELQKTSELAAGGPASSAAVTFVRLGIGQQNFLVSGPNDGTKRHYRARHVKVGYTAGAYTDWNCVILKQAIGDDPTFPGPSVPEENIEDDAITHRKVADKVISHREMFFGSPDNLITNPGLEQSSTDADPWDVTSPAGGSFALVTANMRSGGVALQYDPTGQTGAALARINGAEAQVGNHPAVAEGDQIYVEVFVRALNAGAANAVRVDIRWRDETGALISTSTGTNITPTQTYAKTINTATAPAGVAYFAARVRYQNDGNTNPLIIDDAYARRTVTTEIIKDDAITNLKVATGDREVRSGSLFVLNTETMKVGTIASPTKVSKTIRFPAPEFLPFTDTTIYTSVNGYIGPSNTTTVSQRFDCPFVMPPGVTLVATRARMYRDTTSETAAVSFFKVNDDGTLTGIGGALTHDTTGWATFSATISELVGSLGYIAQFTGKNNTTSDVKARILWFELDYEMPSYNKGY